MDDGKETLIKKETASPEAGPSTTGSVNIGSTIAVIRPPRVVAVDVFYHRSARTAA